MGNRMRGAGAVIALLVWAGTAQAATSPTSRWLPNPPTATWTYQWTDSAYSTAPTIERYTVSKRTDNSVQLAWTVPSTADYPGSQASNGGTIDYTYTDGGIVNTTWSSTPPPGQFPILCATVGQCGNSLAGAHYVFVWGTRSPFLQEPLVRGATWTAAGGQNNDVAAVNRYRGVQRVVVPAFPKGVFAAVIDSDITQAGAIGDPYGSGLRTTWWVYGVGPVKSVFKHAGGEVTTVELRATNLKVLTAPSDRVHLPLRKGDVMRYRYTDSRHMSGASVQQLTVTDVANNTARIDVKSLSGPISVVGTYLLTTRNSGVLTVSAATKTATKAHFPALGPRSQPPANRRHFFTVLDLLEYGFNPVITAFPHKGQSWKSSRSSRDFATFGVDGKTKVIGTRKVTVPRGTYRALLLESRLKQRGFPFGSGVRRAWFAPGVGLVKLEFRHADGSVSRVVRLP